MSRGIVDARARAGRRRMVEKCMTAELRNRLETN
jgi:hypothetical protein